MSSPPTPSLASERRAGFCRRHFVAWPDLGLVVPLDRGLPSGSCPRHPDRGAADPGRGCDALFLAITRPRRPTRRQVGHLAVLGAVNAGFPIFIISWGQQYVDSGTAAVLNSLTPIFSLLIAGLLLRTEMWSPLQGLGVLVGFAGAVVLASRVRLQPGPGGHRRRDSGDRRGGELRRGSQLREVPHPVDRPLCRGRRDTRLRRALYLWVVALIADGSPVLPTQPAAIIGLLWLGLLGSFFAYILYFFLIAHLGATVSTWSPVCPRRGRDPRRRGPRGPRRAASARCRAGRARDCDRGPPI